MSDWSDEIQKFEENNIDDLSAEFIEKNSELWYDFVSEKFFSGGCR